MERSAHEGEVGTVTVALCSAIDALVYPGNAADGFRRRGWVLLIVVANSSSLSSLNVFVVIAIYLCRRRKLSPSLS